MAEGWRRGVLLLSGGGCVALGPRDPKPLKHCCSARSVGERFKTEGCFAHGNRSLQVEGGV